MRRLRRLISILMLVFLIPVTGHAEGEIPTVRVLLRRLALTDRADLTLSAPYAAACDGTEVSLPSGTRVVAQIRSGQIYLSMGGMTLRGGKRVILTRYGTTESTEGLRFQQGGGIYPGDLTLTISGGMLQAVMKLSVEDYLLGVVPYEMSESFPLEALKAQAICARTYALSHVNNKAEYDVVDTTNDQVFRGVDPANVNAAKAVALTCGIVGMYKGSLATCYYAASNGGQTELPSRVWGGTDPGYYQVTDDPYDLANTESIVRRKRLAKDGSNLPDDLRATLLNALSQQAPSKGFLSGTENIRLDAIEAITPGSSCYGGNSRVYTALTFTVRWSGRMEVTPMQSQPGDGEEEWLLFGSPQPAENPGEPSAQPTPYLTAFIESPEPAVITLALFPEMIRALNLVINGTDNELVTVVDEGSSFAIESRRFGHGVGMSQRGAQQMASAYGMTFDQILSFYYPGMQLMVGGVKQAAAPTLPGILFNTPGPPATPTPRPTLMPVTGTVPPGAYLASVEGIEDDSTLNLRAEPTAASEVLMRLFKHQQLVVLEACEDPSWVHVKTDSMEGYVMVSFLEKLSP